MTGVDVRLEPPLSFIESQAGAFRRELENLVPLWELYEPIMSSIEQERFDTRGYGEWPALAESTLADKERHGYPLDPLVRTGDLRDSLTSAARAADKGPRRFVWGSDVPYAQYHQEGTDRMPQRTVLEIRAEDRRRLEAATITWINAAARRTWGRI